VGKEKLLFDKTEIVAIDKENKVKNLTKDNIINVKVDNCKAGLFGKPSKRIAFKLRNEEKPLLYFRHKEKDYFGKYVDQLRKFCKENNISLSVEPDDVKSYQFPRQQ